MTTVRQRSRRCIAVLFCALAGWTAPIRPAAAINRLPVHQEREGHSFSVRVLDGQRPVPSAEVFIGIHRAGRTDGRGIYRHFYTTRPEQSLHLAVRKPGFHEWNEEVRIRPGGEIRVGLIPETSHRILIQAVTERLGVLSGLAGMEVVVGGEYQGVTDADGEFIYSRAMPGAIELSIRHPQDLAPAWSDTVSLQGDLPVRHFFYPMEPERLQVAVLPFRANGFMDDTPGAVMEAIRESMVEELSDESGFHLLGDDELGRNLEWYGIDDRRLAERGWEDTDLRWNLDLIVVGSVGRDDEFVTEVVVRWPSGEEVLRVLDRADGPEAVPACGRRIARAILERFPYRGWIRAVAGDALDIRIDPGTGWNPTPGEAVILHSFVRDRWGRRLGEIRIGSARILRVDGALVEGRVERATAPLAVSPGDMAIRFLPPPIGVVGPVDFELVARSGEEPHAEPLEGVNVYLDGYWVGRTDRDGRARLGLPDDGSYRLDLYRHGYGPAKRIIRLPRAGVETQVLLEEHFSILRIDTVPSGAEIWLDGRPLGRTPIVDGIRVSPGEHEIDLEAGEDYRPFRRRFAVRDHRVDLTGAAAIVLEKDFLAVGKRNEDAGDVGGAIRTYREVPGDHSDSWEAHRRLAFLLLGPGGDPQDAIEEFLILLSAQDLFPEEVDRLVEIFAGIGRAYLGVGDDLVGTDSLMAETKYLQGLFYLHRARLITEILPELDVDRLFHDITYYRALAYQKLYGLTARREFLRDADEAWQEYFDFAPDTLLENPEVRKAREAGRRFWSEIREDLP
jgi:hypothetical protein